MKKRVYTFNLFTVIVVIGLLIFFVWVVYKGFTSDEFVETVQENVIGFFVDAGEDEEEKDTISNSTSNGSSLVEVITSNTNTETSSGSNSIDVESADSDFFYNQLTDTQKIFYDGLLDSKEKMKTGTYTIEFGDVFSDILEQDNGSEELGDDYQAAIDAYINDNPDIFYIDVSKLYLNIETTKKTFSTKYNVYIAPQSGETYFADIFSSEEEVENAIEAVEEEKDFILSKLSGNDYDDIKTVHDYLITNIEYDQYYESADPYSLYGALIDKKAVCEGYAEAFKYLLNAAGMECELIQGTATNSEGTTENHEWNCVCIENTWYYIDVTWDDPVVVGGNIGLKDYNYQYFLKGTATFAEDHVEKYQFVDGGREFYYPTISSTDYEI